MAEEYTETFFQDLREGALRSAAVIVPLVLHLIRPRSVVDVGCGTGAWLATFARHGVADYLGVDGFTPAGLLEIPRDRFLAADLTRPLTLGREFDLAVSLEVAEHLPGSAAGTIVESLTRLAPAVLFSAAIPGQGGTGHLNEQWPDYWARLFADHGFGPVDALRPRIWHEEHVEFWYAQNTMLYVAEGRQGEFPNLQEAAAVGPPLAAVHPRLFADHDRRLSEAVRMLADVNEALMTERHRIEILGRDLARYRFMAEPRNMGLRPYVRALPHVLRGALRRARQRIRWGPRPS
jgi:SAM-dependent methyltransferase